MEDQKSIYKIVAQGIERVRNLCGYSKQGFAEYLGVSTRAYTYWVDGSGNRRTRPSLDTLQLIMDKTGYSLNEFFPGPIHPHDALITLCELHGLKVDKPKPGSPTDRLGKITKKTLDFKDNMKALEKIEASLEALKWEASSKRKQRRKKKATKRQKNKATRKQKKKTTKKRR